MEKKIIVKFDGACSGNGQAYAETGIGVHAQYEGDAQGSLFEIAEHGGVGTNNTAEYLALLMALVRLAEEGYTNNEIEVIGDSQLVIKQVLGEYKCKQPTLQKYHREVLKEIGKFKNIKLTHVKRNQNQYADELSKQGLNKGNFSTR